MPTSVSALRQQDEAAGEIHVLGHQRPEQQRPRGRQAEHDGAMIVTPETRCGSTQPIVETKGFSAMRTRIVQDHLVLGQALRARA